MLGLRRLFAFFVDCSPFVCLWAAIGALRLLGFLAAPAWIDGGLFIALFVYLGLVESLTGGISPGKKLLGIAIASRDGKILSPSTHFRRALVGAALYPVAMLLASGAKLVLSAAPTSFASFLAFPALAMVFQCLLFVSTGGRLGIADLFLDTVAVAVSESQSGPFVGGLRRIVLMSVASAITLSLFVAAVGASLGALIESNMERQSSPATTQMKYSLLIWNRLRGIVGERATPDSVFDLGMKSCTSADRVEMKTVLPYVFLPVREFPEEFENCWTLRIQAQDIYLMMSSDFKLALGAAVSSTLRAEDGPFGGHPQPTLVFLTIEHMEPMAFSTLFLSQELVGYFLPEETISMHFFDNGFEVGAGHYFTESESRL